MPIQMPIQMPIKEFLDRYRAASVSLNLMRRSLSCRPGWEGSPLSSREKRLHTRQIRDSLRQEQGRLEGQWEPMNEEFDRLLAHYGGTSIQQTILKQYYRAGMTDAEIGSRLGRTPKAVCSLRSRWIRSVEAAQP